MVGEGTVGRGWIIWPSAFGERRGVQQGANAATRAVLTPHPLQPQPAQFPEQEH
jgi:hypothetical protein